MVKEKPKDQPDTDPMAIFKMKVQLLNEEAKKIPVAEQVTIVPAAPLAKPVVPALNKPSEKSKTIKKANIPAKEPVN